MAGSRKRVQMVTLKVQVPGLSGSPMQGGSLVTEQGPVLIMLPVPMPQGVVVDARAGCAGQ